MGLGPTIPFPSLPPSPVLGISGYFRETIRQDIRQARERFSGQQLRQELARLQRRLDNMELLSPDIIMNLLLSYRDVQVCFKRQSGSERQSGYSIQCQDKSKVRSWLCHSNYLTSLSLGF